MVLFLLALVAVADRSTATFRTEVRFTRSNTGGAELRSRIRGICSVRYCYLGRKPHLDLLNAITEQNGPMVKLLRGRVGNRHWHMTGPPCKLPMSGENPPEGLLPKLLLLAVLGQ